MAEPLSPPRRPLNLANFFNLLCVVITIQLSHRPLDDRIRAVLVDVPFDGTFRRKRIAEIFGLNLLHNGTKICAIPAPVNLLEATAKCRLQPL